jgi:hypothetical protein
MAINYYEPPEERDANREAIDELRGEVRALRAIILELSETTSELVAAAKTRLRNKSKNHCNESVRQRAKLHDMLGVPHDKQAEDALDDLAHEAKAMNEHRVDRVPTTTKINKITTIV